MGVTRQTLYEEIWTEPITKVSKRYGVSDSFFIRILQRLNVPRPPMGYWAKLAVGKQLPKPALPDPLPGDEIEWDRNNMPAARSPRELPKAPESPAPVRSLGIYSGASTDPTIMTRIALKIVTAGRSIMVTE